jgi:hypothetical protein
LLGGRERRRALNGGDDINQQENSASASNGLSLMHDGKNQNAGAVDSVDQGKG